MTHVVIIGGGFAGIACARNLVDRDIRVTLIDRCNHHLFQPLLYQVATAALSAPDIAVPIRRLLRKRANTTVLWTEVERIEPARNVVCVSDGKEIHYDELVIAAGMQNGYYGHPEWEEFAPGLKSLEDALALRSNILSAFELAELETDPEKRKELLSFAIVGGGPTGVELAGAIKEIATKTLAQDFRHFDPRDAQVLLLEGGPRLLPSFSEESSEKARVSLVRIGVKVELGARVFAMDKDAIQWRRGETEHVIRAHTKLWAAGVEASPLTRAFSENQDRLGRLLVEKTLCLPGYPNVHIAGDLIALKQDDVWLPGVAQVALQSGALIGQNIELKKRGQPPQEFHYGDKGQMATIGRARAVVEVGESKLSGFVAWLMWLFVHVLFLVDFRNRIAVMMEWAYAYISWNRSSRVIFAGRKRRPED